MRISCRQWQALLHELEHARQQRCLLTYRALIERLALATPAMRTLAAALEHLARLDAEAARPLRSALVVSQGASRLPAIGFYEALVRLGRFAGELDGGAMAAWHAREVARVFEHDYPREG